MLPSTPLPSINSLVPGSGQPLEEFYYYPCDQYYSSPFINIAYPPPAIYIEQYPPPPSYQTVYPVQELVPTTSGEERKTCGVGQKAIEEKRKKKKEPRQVRSDGICSHCSTNTTTLWRKNDNGDLECNACNLYFRRNNVKRPLALCKEKIATRNRRKAQK